MGNVAQVGLCTACKDDCSAMEWSRRDEVDLQSEYAPLDNGPNSVVCVTEDASSFPRVALGQQDVGKEMGKTMTHKLPYQPVKLDAMKSRDLPDSVEKSPMEKSMEVTPTPEVERHVPSLEVIFDVKGEEKKIQIFHRPLGAEFSKKAKGPTKVSKIHPQSYANKLGIEVGWILKSIAGEDVSEKTFKDTQNALKDGMMALPPCNDAA